MSYLHGRRKEVPCCEIAWVCSKVEKSKDSASGEGKLQTTCVGSRLGTHILRSFTNKRGEF